MIERIYGHVNWRPGERDLRLFSSAMLFLLTVIGFIVWHRTGDNTVLTCTVPVGMVIVIIGILRYSLLLPLYRFWMAVMTPVMFVVQNVLLIIIFFIAFMPVGILMKMMGRDPLTKHRDPAADSYWVLRRNKRKPEDYFRQY